MKKLKSIFAILTLAVFLFPQIEITVHDFNHRNDFICKSAKEHLHTAQHHCILCDFANDFIAYPSFNNNPVLVFSAPSSEKFIFVQDYYQIAQKSSPTLRGPPSLV